MLFRSDGKRRDVDISHKELIALGMYYNRPPEELVFLTTREHNAIRKVSAETRNKIREAKKGKYAGENHPFYGKHHTEESKRKIGEANKGNKNMLGKHHSEEARNKIGAAKKGNKYNLGRHWYNNGKISIMAKECPPGFTPGRIKKP